MCKKQVIELKYMLYGDKSGSFPGMVQKKQYLVNTQAYQNNYFNMQIK